MSVGKGHGKVPKSAVADRPHAHEGEHHHTHGHHDLASHSHDGEIDGPVHHEHDGLMHAHGAGSSHRIPGQHTKRNAWALTASLAVTVAVMVLEFVFSLISNSVALASDAGHMATHAFAIALGLGAIVISRRAPTVARTFGLFRAEVLAAFINGLFLLAVAGVIVYEAAVRLANPADVDSTMMLVVAVIGLLANIISMAFLWSADKGDLNVKAVLVHLVYDAASSVGVVAAATVIYFTKWQAIDPIVSIVISVAIAYWAFDVLRQSVEILLETAPKGMDAEVVATELAKAFPEAMRVHDVHIWTITTGMHVVSAHVCLDAGCGEYDCRERIVTRMNKHLHEKFGFVESTIQLDEPAENGTCAFK